MTFKNKKSAFGANLNADLINSNKSYFKPLNRKIKPVFPEKADPLFCSFDSRIAGHINRVGFCYFIYKNDYYSYDLNFSAGKEIWIFYISQSHRELSIKFGYALLRNGASKVQIIFFPLEDVNHDR